MKNNYLVAIVLSVLLTGCGGSASESRPVDPVPTLVGYDIIDSYGVNTALSNQALEIDPYIDNGLFDVLWRVNSLEDYQVNVRLSSTPNIYNSVLIYSEVCGAGLSCDQGGNVICQYSEDYYLSCGRSAARSVGHLPKNAYLILEACDLDSSFCHYDYYPVTML